MGKDVDVTVTITNPCSEGTCADSTPAPNLSDCQLFEDAYVNGGNLDDLCNDNESANSHCCICGANIASQV